MLEPVTRGDPESPLRWTCKSVRRLAEELKPLGHRVSYPVVAELLHELGYSLQANRKTKEGDAHPDRKAQFEYLNQKVKRYMQAGQPVISVDTKKKELIGDFKNGGREWRPQGDPERVRIHDFVIRERGRATPYGIYDLAQNAAWVSVGVDHDTSAFAVESIRRWWYSMGKSTYPQATRLLITADSGGSNGSRVRLWKLELQKLANENSPADRRQSFPAGDQQVEQDRTPAILLYQPKLARSTVDQPGSDCQPHRRHYHSQGVEGAVRTGPRLVPSGSQSP